MPYMLVCDDGDGHEYRLGPFASIAALNDLGLNELHHATEGYSVLRIEEDHDGPRTWAIAMPDPPPVGTRVLGRLVKGSVLLTVGEGGRVEHDRTNYSWENALKFFGPLTEVTETEVEAAARRLLERLADDKGLAPDPDAELVLRHVLNGGRL